MHGLQLLHTTLSKSCPQIHSYRLSSLLEAVEGLLNGGKLTLVQIGRYIPGSAIIKNKIKQIDRLLGNSHLHQEKKAIYYSLSCTLIKPNSQPLILVDWSGVTPCGAFHMIRASIPLNGRTLTIYEEVYPESQKDSSKANREFLKNLASVLPLGCRPIVVTDAGFRNPWFKEIKKLGWDFVGRVRNKTKVKEIAKSAWKSCKDLYRKATRKAQFVGDFFLAKSNPLPCKMYLIKGKRKYRKKKNLKGHKVRCSSSLKHAKRNKEPWLIATSLSAFSAKEIIRIYQLRMCIEQGFRDIKNYRHGFCFRESRSTTAQRLSILLLIGMLATYIVCIYGHASQLLKIQYQTNSIKSRTLLSWFYLGILVIKNTVVLTKELILKTLYKKIIEEIHYV